MWDLDITNIAGIQSADVTVTEGLNVVQASNFTGKSSFMSAIQTVMGTSGMFSEEHPLTEAADEGSVHLETDESSYEVHLTRSQSGSISRSGSTVLENETDRTCARLFAFLGESNPIRYRVRNDQDLTELLQAPLNIEDIDAQIASLKRERESVTQRLHEAEQALENVSPVQEAVTQLEEELDDLRQRREDMSQRTAAKGSSDDDMSDELAERRSSLTTTTQTLSRLQNQLDRKEEQLEDAKEELAAIELPKEPEMTADIEQKENRITDLELKIDLLENLYRVNQRVIEEEEVGLVADVDRGLTGDEFDCWVCGETTATEDIQNRLSALQDKIANLRDERSTLTTEIEEIKQKKKQYQETRQEQSQLEETVGRLKADIDETKSDLQQAEERKAQLKDDVERLEARVAEADEQLNEELTDIKAKIRTKESELDEQNTRLETLRKKGEEADELRAEKERLSEEITALRNRKTETQWELKEQFDTAMTEAIERFAPGFDGARLDVKTTPENEIEAFELIIARDGQETTIQKLSEGERELVGIIVTVAGYRTFEVRDRVPAMLLDGISQLSADNLQRLIEYLADSSKILVTTAYPEAGTFDGHHISPDQWDVVSDRELSPA